MQPQQDHPAPPPPTAPTATARSRGRTATAAVWLAVGLVIGGGGVGAAWALNGDGTTSESGTAAADAHAACEALDGFDESRYTEKGPTGEIAVNRYAAAGAFSASAAAGDERYEPLAQAIRRSQERHARVFDFDAAAKRDLDKARGICRDL
ncbi:hypothetical protein [Streptomyces formicae]|uniref:hypothetical protein n=1 Tax=Streptomyces formicae TaxID=1616117 RepID=UPI00131D888E|nr:hypothetical protein [Streptomyces formicae]